MALRGLLATALDASGLLGGLAARHSRATIAMYHRILPRSAVEFSAADPGMVVSLEAFRMHVREYASRFEVVPLRDLPERLAGALAPEKPLLVITFDDGWLDTYELAAPELHALGLPATIFATVKYVQAGAAGEPFATSGQLGELARNGFEIGSHTWSHRELIGVEGRDLEREVSDSRTWLEDALGGPIVSFAYPRGKYDATVANAVRQAYRSAVTVNPGYCRPGVDLALLPRIGIHDDMTNSLPRLRWRLAGMP